MATMTMDHAAAPPAKKPWYRLLYVQVLIAIVLGVLFGWLAPEHAKSDWVKAMGDGFIKLIKMVIAPIIFCTIVSGIAHIQDAKKVGRVGLKALIYFEVVSTFALIVPLSLIVAVIRDRLFEVALLSRSRERIVAAREDERRRLRRDLPDGLAPSLAALGLRLDHVRQIVRTEPEVAEAGIDAARAEVRAVIADIRRMSRELRPPALDTLGLVGAVREQAAALGAEAPGPPDIVVDAPKALPPLPAAVEVAAYRIAVEAMMNVVRHASATTCRVELTLDPDALDIEVVDNGRGLDRSSNGVGLRSMRERAAEVGGDVMITDGETGGTRVLARLPVELSALGVADA